MTLTPRQVADGAGRHGPDRPALDRRWPAAATRVGSPGPRVAFVARGRRATPAPGIAARRSAALLIANRGEIAVRVARTARRMGIRVVGVHAAGRAPARRRRRGARDRLVPRRRRAPRGRRGASGADAIHPGYGFLAENPEFAAPSAAAGPGLGRAARRRRSRQWATRPRRVGARPLTACRPSPATTARRRTTRRWRREAARIGYPAARQAVSAGGGGKGMRVVAGAAELAEALAAARREAHRVIRRRSADPRALPRRAAPRRGPGAVRRARQRASTSASATASPSGATRRSSRRRRRPRSRPSCGRGWARRRWRSPAAVGYVERRHGRDAPDRRAASSSSSR